MRRGASFHPVQPHVAIDAAILRPVGLDLHMQEKMDLATKLLRHFLPRGLADLLDPRAAEIDRKRTRLNSRPSSASRMPSSASTKKQSIHHDTTLSAITSRPPTNQ